MDRSRLSVPVAAHPRRSASVCPSRYSITRKGIGVADVGDSGSAAFAHIVQVANVGMVQRRYGSGFTLEPFTLVAVGRKLRRQNLDRDRAVKTYVTRLVDLAHPAGPEEPEDVMRTEARAGWQTHAAGSLGGYLTCPTRERCINVWQDTCAGPSDNHPSTTLSCSLTSCRNWSGASPDDGRFPVHPSSLIPSEAR
jgi:hypothetical protein